MWSFEAVNLLLGLVAIVTVTTTVGSMFALFWATRRKKLATVDLPPISVFKPLRGLDEELEQNLRSFFLIDYPRYELLFCVADADDPAIAVVEALRREFPDRDATLIAGCPHYGLNPKVRNLAAMERIRKYDVILVSDSNVRVRPSYLRETAAYLDSPKVGLVSNIFVGVGEESAGAVMENLELNGFIAGGVAAAGLVGATCVVGKSMLIPSAVLRAIGGFAAVRNVLAEDQVIGIRVQQAGYQIKLSHHVIENVNRERSFRWFLNRHSRWYKIRRRVAPLAFAIEPAANPAAVGVVWAFSGESGIAWGGLLLLVGMGMARDALQTRWLRGSFPRMRDLLLSPAKDLLLLPVWFDAIVNRRINWRGHRFLVGRMTRLRSSRATRQLRRRVRRVHRLRNQPGDRPPTPEA